MVPTFKGAAQIGQALSSVRRTPAAAWLVLGAVAIAEAVTTLGSLQFGLFAHLTLIVILVVIAARGHRGPMGQLALGLILVPMIRVLSIGLPLDRVPQIAWYPMVATPIFVSMFLVMRQTGLSPRQVGLCWGNVPRELAIGASGITFGVVEYQILRPESLLTTQSVSHLILVIAILAIFTGIFEELLFRGILQQLAWHALELPGLVLISLLFAAMHMGYRSPLDLLFVGAVGALFAYVVLRGGSLLGVSLAHALTNVVLFIVMPGVASSPDSPMNRIVVGLAWGGAALALAALLWLALDRS